MRRLHGLSAHCKDRARATEYFVEKAEKLGFKPFVRGEKYKCGDKVYLNNRGKAVILCVMGKEPVENGIRLSAAHIDSPRLDLKPNPLYEDNELAYFKTHYYGGIKNINGPLCRSRFTELWLKKTALRLR